MWPPCKLTPQSNIVVRSKEEWWMVENPSRKTNIIDLCVMKFPLHKSDHSRHQGSMVNIHCVKTLTQVNEKWNCIGIYMVVHVDWNDDCNHGMFHSCKFMWHNVERWFYDYWYDILMSCILFRCPLKKDKTQGRMGGLLSSLLVLMSYWRISCSKWSRRLKVLERCKVP